MLRQFLSLRVPVLLAVLLLGLPAAARLQAEPVQGYQVLARYPHDPDAFTQGLVFSGGQLYESDGLYGHSVLRRVDLRTGRTVQERDLPAQLFAEGLTDWGNTLIQLTWKAHTGFVYDRTTFRLLRTFSYPWEGWGLTEDGRELILSDGTATLHFLDPRSFEQVRSLIVTDHGKPVPELNELEYVRGEIYANIWFSDRIARISPVDGRVLGWINLAGILPQIERPNSNAVLNGIAYDPAHQRLWVTGKLWPELFQVRLTPAVSGSKITNP